MHRYELEDRHWALVEPLLPQRRTRGRWWRDHRQVLNGILWVLFSGAPWRDLPERYGPWQTAHRRLSTWRADGTWDRVLHRLRLRADHAGLLDYGRWLVDSTSIRSTRAAAGAPKKDAGQGRAVRPRDRVMPRRDRDKAAPGDRGKRPADRHRPDLGPAQRVPDVRHADRRDAGGVAASSAPA
jgi:transposase